MLEILITSKTRIKLLVKLFVNPKTTAYLRNLESDFEESTNGIRQELNRFEKANLLISEKVGNKKVYRANANNPFFTDIQQLTLKYFGVNQIIDTITPAIGSIQNIFLSDDYSTMYSNSTLDFVFVGDNFNQAQLKGLIEIAEVRTSKKIRYITISKTDDEHLTQINENDLLVWSRG